jgi:hypothetical protein
MPLLAATPKQMKVASNHLNANQELATRYEKRAVNYRAM